MRRLARRTPLARALAVAAIAIAAGCGSDSPRRAAPAPPPDGAADEPPGAGPVVFLRRRPASPAGGGAGAPSVERAEDELVTLDVVARGVPRSVHGAAFRLRWEPDELAFVEARAGAAWSRRALTLAREGLPGELVVAWTERGRGGGLDATGEALLGAVTFRRRTPGGAAIAFRAERSTLRDPSGDELTVAWRGGRVPAP